MKHIDEKIHGHIKHNKCRTFFVDVDFDGSGIIRKFMTLKTGAVKANVISFEFDKKCIGDISWFSIGKKKDNAKSKINVPVMFYFTDKETVKIFLNKKKEKRITARMLISLYVDDSVDVKSDSVFNLVEIK